MSKDLALLKRKYEEIAELTRPKCLGECPEPGRCCTPAYCDLAELRAKEYGRAFPYQGHPTLKFLGEQGCVVPPYLRPLCAVHVCEIHLLNGDAYSEEYFEIREEVCELEEELGPSWPQGLARDYWE